MGKSKLSLSDAIKHCEEVATENEKTIAYYTIQGDKEWLDECEKDCIECAKEHRQLAEWLKELKAYKDARVGCEYCKHKYREIHERPCSLCKRNFVDMFEREINADGEIEEDGE